MPLSQQKETTEMSTASLARRHAPGELQCPKCNHEPFANRKGLAMHNARVHDRSILVPHEKRAHVNGHEFKCAKCGEPFKNEHGLHIHEARAHNRRHAKSPRAMVDLVLETFASKPHVNDHEHEHEHTHSLGCTECHYDLEPLIGSEKPAAYCPGCATPIQTMVDRLAALAKGRVLV